MSIMLENFSDEFLYDVAIRLVELGADVEAIIVGVRDIYNKMIADDRLESTRIIDSTIELEYADAIYNLNTNSTESLSAEFIESLYEGESFFMSITDRMTAFPISVQERKSIYYELALYWYRFLKNSDIDTIICLITPHMNWAIVLSYVAEALGIQIIYIQTTPINNRLLLLDDYRKVRKVPGDYLRALGREDIISHIDPDLLKEVFSDSLFIKHSDNVRGFVFEHLESDVGTLSFRKLKQLGVKPFIQKVGKRLGISDLFRKIYSNWLAMNNIHSSIIKALFSIAYNFKLSLLYRFYSRNVSSVDYESKFVVYYLHMQPERTVTPEGGVFRNQVLAIRILSRSVPEGWTVYVKEHPSQFMPYRLNGTHYRSKEYYRRILRLGNVKLIDMEADREKLIEKAEFVSTLNGTVGWESLLQKKACVVFGSPSYAPCNSCYVVHSISDCQNALDAISQKTALDVEKDVLKFLAYYSDKFIVAPHRGRFAHPDIPYENLVENLAAGIMHHMRSERSEGITKGD